MEVITTISIEKFLHSVAGIALSNSSYRTGGSGTYTPFFVKEYELKKILDSCSGLYVYRLIVEFTDNLLTDENKISEDDYNTIFSAWGIPADA